MVLLVFDMLDATTTAYIAQLAQDVNYIVIFLIVITASLVIDLARRMLMTSRL